MAKNYEALCGQRFGKWHVLAFLGEGHRHHGKYQCVCDCGTIRVVDEYSLLLGRSKSCGCSLMRGKYRTDTKLYKVWNSIRRRCQSPKQTGYARYGGRGIAMCDEWAKSYDRFHEWAVSNSYVDGLQIDRIDNDGNYEPSNCRWVTRQQNSTNKRGRPGKYKYKGIYNRGGKWSARIRFKGIYYYSRVVETDVEAAIEHDKLAVIHHGEFAYLNFPQTLKAGT